MRYANCNQYYGNNTDDGNDANDTYGTKDKNKRQKNRYRHNGIFESCIIGFKKRAEHTVGTAI